MASPLSARNSGPLDRAGLGRALRPPPKTSTRATDDQVVRRPAHVLGGLVRRSSSSAIGGCSACPRCRPDGWPVGPGVTARTWRPGPRRRAGACWLRRCRIGDPLAADRLHGVPLLSARTTEARPAERPGAAAWDWRRAQRTVPATHIALGEARNRRRAPAHWKAGVAHAMASPAAPGVSSAGGATEPRRMGG